VSDAAAATPMSAADLAALADKYWRIRQQRLAADKVAEALKTDESAAEATLIAQMRLQNLTAIGGAVVRLSLPTVPEYKPAVKDWQALYSHILASRDFSLLQKRVGEAACKERWAADVEVPGVEKFPVYKLSKSEVKS
jgi:hypothetical protein